MERRLFLEMRAKNFWGGRKTGGDFRKNFWEKGSRFFGEMKK